MAGFDIPDLYDKTIMLHVSDHAAYGSFSVFPLKVDEEGNPTDEVPACIHIPWYKLADLLRWIGAKVEEPAHWRDASIVEIPVEKRES